MAAAAPQGVAGNVQQALRQLQRLTIDEKDAVLRFAKMTGERNLHRQKEKLRRAQPAPKEQRGAEPEIEWEAAQRKREAGAALRRSKGESGHSEGDILWVMHYAILVLVLEGFFACTIWLSFILVPLIMAYFVSFLLTPLTDLFENRPLVCCGRTYCESCCRKSLSRSYRLRQQGAFHSCIARLLDFFLLGRLPHSMAVLVALLVACGMVVLCVVGLFYSLKSMGDESGQTLVLEFQRTWEAVITFLREEGGIRMSLDFSEIGFSEDRGWSMSAVNGVVFSLGMMMNNGMLVLLLAVYIMLGRETYTSPSNASEVTTESEELVKAYLKVKTSLSLLIGVAVYAIYAVCGVQLAFVWGVLAFVMHYIPYIGVLISLALPLPFILLSPDLKLGYRLTALIGPPVVQALLGTVAEGRLLAKTLNLHRTAVFVVLVIAWNVWSFVGAIVSVPLLGVVRVVAAHTDHPMARITANMIRQEEDENEKQRRQHQVFRKGFR